MSEPVKLWRYAIPSIQGEGWATVVIGSDGFFAAVSDYGDYAHFWGHHGLADFRKLFVERSETDSYLLKKLGGPEIYNAEATEAAIREYVEDADNFSKPAAQAHEKDLLEDQDFTTERDFTEWLESTRMDDAYEFEATRPRPDVVAFVAKVIPRLGKLLEVELAAERGAGVASASV